MKYRKSFFTLVLKYRYYVIVLSAIFTIVCILLGKNVKPDFSAEQFFPLWDPNRVTYEKYKKHFPQEDSQIVLFWNQEKTPDTKNFREMETAAAYFKEVGVENITWFGNALTISVNFNGLFFAPSIKPLIEKNKLSDKYLQGILETNKNDYLYKNTLWNETQNVFLISGNLPKELNTDKERKRVTAFLLDKIQSLEKPERKLVLSGLPVLRAKFLNLFAKDQLNFISTSLILVMLLMFFFFRRPGQVFLSFFSIIPSYLLVLSLLYLFDKPMTVLTSTLPTILLVLGLSDTIHILSRYRKLRLKGMDNHPAIVEAFCELSSSCFYTSITTALGFLTLISTGITIIVDFAVFTAIGIMAAYLCAMVIFPALLGVYSGNKFNDRSFNAGWINFLIEKSLYLARYKAGWILTSFTVLLLLSPYYASKLEVNAYLFDGLKQNHPLSKDLKWIEEQGFGLFQVNLFIEGEENVISSENLEWIEKLENNISSEPIVIRTVSPVDKIKKLNQVISHEFTLPETDTQILALTGLAGQLGGKYLSEVLDSSENKAQIIISVKDHGSKIMNPLIDKIEKFITENPLPDGKITVTGTVKLAQTSFLQVVSGFKTSLFLAIILIFVLMVFMFRSLKYGIIGLIPNVFPIIFLTGLFVILGYEIKPSSVVIFSIAFSIAVDDTIHVLGTYKKIREEKGSTDEAIRESFIKSGNGLIITSMVISIGFSALMLSDFYALFMLGLMISVALIIALFSDLILLPVLLFMFSEDRRTK